MVSAMEPGVLLSSLVLVPPKRAKERTTMEVNTVDTHTIREAAGSQVENQVVTMVAKAAGSQVATQVAAVIDSKSTVLTFQMNAMPTTFCTHWNPPSGLAVTCVSN